MLEVPNQVGFRVQHAGAQEQDAVCVRQGADPGVTLLIPMRCTTAIVQSTIPLDFFMPPARRSKMVFVYGKAQTRAALAPHMAPAQLYQALGGDRPDDFDFDAYDAYMTVVDAQRCAAAAAGAQATAAKCAEEVIFY